MIGGESEDRCRSCGSPMVSDQRYCLHCGERRGKSRFSMEGMAAQMAPPPPPPAPSRPVRSRVPGGVTLVTGVATLLLAMGVGVLIGHDSSSSPLARASQPVQVVTVGSGGTAVASTAAKKVKPQSSKAAAKAAGVGKPTIVHLTKKTIAAATSARQQVFGQNSNKLAPATVQPGQACAHGAGCQGGKFTGNFFH